MKHSYLQGFLLTITIYIGYCMLIININSKVYLDGSKKKKKEIQRNKPKVKWKVPNWET